MVPLTSGNPFSDDHFETKLQAKFDKYDQSFKHQEEELMGFKGKQHQELKQIEKNWILPTQKHFASQNLLKY